jgi:general secretion pathway protein I
LYRSSALESNSAGFTLIEVLVALSIVAVTMSSIGALIATSTRGTRSIEGRVARLETIRAVLTALPPRDQLVGNLTGLIGGQPWRVEVTPFAMVKTSQPSEPAWVPQTVVVTVHSPEGGTTQVSTVRLQRRDPPK